MTRTVPPVIHPRSGSHGHAVTHFRSHGGRSAQRSSKSHKPSSASPRNRIRSSVTSSATSSAITPVHRSGRTSNDIDYRHDSAMPATAASRRNRQCPIMPDQGRRIGRGGVRCLGRGTPWHRRRDPGGGGSSRVGGVAAPRSARGPTTRRRHRRRSRVLDRAFLGRRAGSTGRMRTESSRRLVHAPARWPVPPAACTSLPRRRAESRCVLGKRSRRRQFRLLDICENTRKHFRDRRSDLDVSNT